MTKANNVSTGEFTRALFRGNGGYFLLAVLHTVTLTCANLMLSWLMQQLIDLATGANTGYSLTQLAILSVCSLLLLALAFVFTYHATPRFIANAIGAYKNLVFSKIAKKNIAAFSKENTAFYVSALSNDANTIETNYLANIFNIFNQGLLLAAGHDALVFAYADDGLYFIEYFADIVRRCRRRPGRRSRKGSIGKK